MEPGTIIAITEIAYKSAIRAVKAVRTAVHFPDDAEDLLVQLELERFRLQTWGRNSGLEGDGLVKSLHPVFDEIRNRLNCIEVLFGSTTRLQREFGIVPIDGKDMSAQRSLSLSNKLNTALCRVGLDFEQSADAGQPSLEQDNESFLNKEQLQPNLSRRIKWALGNRSKFSSCILGLENHANKLNQLLSETQTEAMTKDWTRINIVVLGNMYDERSIEVLRKALHGASMSRDLGVMLERKALATMETIVTAPLDRGKLSLRDFVIPAGALRNVRFVARLRSSGDLYLLEKKLHNNQQSQGHTTLLKARLSRLVAMLNMDRGPEMLRARDYIEDAASKCWWIVFHCPTNASATPAGSLGDVPLVITLQERLGPKKRKEAPLETRLNLACVLARSYCKIFSSGWLHKGIRSDTIVYVGTTDLLLPRLLGFEFSRQELEASNVDAATSPRQAQEAIYRHPSYIGDQATGYRVEYDMYSFGLMLLEIAVWGSLQDLIFIKQPSVTGVQLHREMESFGKAEAEEVRARALRIANDSLSFRVGSTYSDVVRWCLSCDDKTNRGLEEDWHPALKFNDRVVVPLEDSIPRSRG